MNPVRKKVLLINPPWIIGEDKNLWKEVPVVGRVWASPMLQPSWKKKATKFFIWIVRLNIIQSEILRSFKKLQGS